MVAGEKFKYCENEKDVFTSHDMNLGCRGETRFEENHV